MEQILIIDDDAQVRATLLLMLAREGYEVVVANDGRQGVACYKENRPDLVITDMLMPEMGGIETITELRHIFPGVKIIALSGGGRVDKNSHLKVAEHFGAQEILAKPIEKHVLLAAVKALLQ